VPLPPTFQHPARGQRTETMFSAAIDLITPPSSPRPAARVHDGSVIDLISSEDEEPTGDEDYQPAALPQAAGKRKAPAPPQQPAGKRKVPRPSQQQEEDSDDDFAEVAAPVRKPMCDNDASSSGAASSPAAGGDEECVFVGRVGVLALADFPHARENCALHPFGNKTSSCCVNCYCYVCDALASTCPKWDGDHCKATHKSPVWRRARENWPKEQAALAAVREKASLAAPACSSGGSRVASGSGDGSGGAPSGATSISSPQTLPLKMPTNSASQDRSLSSEQMAKAVEQVYPVESQAPAGLLSTIQLRPYQKQSLAFMLDMESSTDTATLGHRNGRSIRGGWLSDEVGMGKTMVCTALVLANPSSPPAAGESKTTLVICQNTLVAQWADELRKYAPGLRVALHYGSTRNYNALLNEYDVVVTSPHMSLTGTSSKQLHRLIIDESHLIGDSKSGGYSSKVGYLKSLRAKYTWLVSGTPFSNISAQASFLGHTKSREAQVVPSGLGLVVGNFHRASLAPVWKKVMIRHSKSQRIHGEAALSLPDATARTELLHMSAEERALYDVFSCVEGTPSWLTPSADKKKAVAHTASITLRRRACSHAYMDLLMKLPSCYTKWPSAARSAWRAMHPVDPARPADDSDADDEQTQAPPTSGHNFEDRTKAQFLLKDALALQEKDRSPLPPRPRPRPHPLHATHPYLHQARPLPWPCLDL